jgi:hypothetical protein
MVQQRIAQQQVETDKSVLRFRIVTEAIDRLRGLGGEDQAEFLRQFGAQFEDTFPGISDSLGEMVGKFEAGGIDFSNSPMVRAIVDANPFIADLIKQDPVKGIEFIFDNEESLLENAKKKNRPAITAKFGAMQAIVNQASAAAGIINPTQELPTTVDGDILLDRRQLQGLNVFLGQSKDPNLKALALSESEMFTLLEDDRLAEELGLKIIRDDLTSPNLIAIGVVGENDKLIAEEIIDLNNDPQALEKLNAATKAGKAIFDPEISATGQGVTQTEQTDLRRLTATTADVLKLSERLRELLATEGRNALVGPVAGLTRLADSAFAQLRGIGELFDEDVTPEAVNALEAEHGGKFKGFAKLSSKVKTNMVRLASILAVLNNDGSRPSNFDAARAEEMVRFTSGSPDQIIAALEEIELQSIDRLDNRLRASGGQPLDRNKFFKDFGLVPQIAEVDKEVEALISSGKTRRKIVEELGGDISGLTEEQLKKLEAMKE